MNSCVKMRFGAIAVGLLLTGCARTQAPKLSTELAAPVGSVRNEPSVVAPEVIGRRPADAPELWLHVQLAGGRKLYRGWPLLVDVSVAHPDGWKAEQEQRPLAPLRVIPASGSWDTLVKTQFFGPAQTVLALPLVQVAHPQGELLLDAEAYRHTLRWYVDPEQTRGLESGAYVAFARLESSSGAQEGGWTGRMDSMPIRFQVVDEPAPLPPELVEGKALAVAQFEMYRGNRDAAWATLEAYRTQHPDSPAILSVEAQMMEDAGKLQEAYDLYGAAIEAHRRKYPKAQEPPVGLMGRQAELGRRLNLMP